MTHAAFRPQILILAAGAASRMRGADKLLEAIDGTPQLRRITEAALATGQPVTIALPPDRPARAACLVGLPAAQITVADAGEGMGASLRAGARALPEGDPVLVVLADLPEITTADLMGLLAQWSAHPDRIARGMGADGTPGHPVGFPADLRDALLHLTGDQGAREILQRHKGRLLPIPLPDQHATTDLDTPEDWADWRAARNS